MKKILLVIAFSVILLGCNIFKNAQVVKEKDLSSVSGLKSFLDGIPVYHAAGINYERNDGTALDIKFSEPVVVAVATKPEKWGYFQFPSIGYRIDRSLQIKWNMAQDAIQAYGKENSGSARSTDGGKTWVSQEESETETVGSVLLPNGDGLEIITPIAIKIEDLKMPKPVGKNLYRLHDMPAIRQGVFLKRLKKGETEWKNEQASLYDPQAARYSQAGLVPVIWRGDIRVAADGSLVAGIYPGHLIGDDGVAIPKSGIFFYKSTDNGHSWRILGRIPYEADQVADPLWEKRAGFSETAFEILRDGTFLAVMRTNDLIGNGPMYASYSKDSGVTWTKPKVITQAGVMPRLLQLKNGVTVMAAGRPGVQLRFSTNGKEWSDSFEMMPFSNDLEAGMTWQGAVSCGYTELLATGPDRFLIVYSDFKYKTQGGELRKAIKVREVTVKER
jgi:hypothetical protein